MINEIEYSAPGQPALKADKLVHERNAWHLKTITGNGMPPTDAMGAASFGIAGQSFSGLSVGSREIEAEIYADGFSAAGCQQMLSDASYIFTPQDYDNDWFYGMGTLRLTNAAGQAYRIAARATNFEVSKMYRKSAIASAIFHCPYAYFEDDVLSIQPIFAVTGGKEYPLNRPYTFGNLEAATATKTFVAHNAGDTPAPVVFKLFGAGLSRVEITNETGRGTIIVRGMSVGGITINTDENNLLAEFEDGEDATPYLEPYLTLSSFVLSPGNNVIKIKMTASSITTAGTVMEWRGRYATCL